MSDRTETAIAALALGAAGLVLAAPVLGRIGLSGLADVAMLGAALCGLAAFAAAARHTLQALRGSAVHRASPRRPDPAERRHC